MTQTTNKDNQETDMDFKTLTLRREAAVLFIEILAPPLNLMGLNW